MFRKLVSGVCLAAILGMRLVASQSTDCSSLECTTSGGHIIVTRESGAPSGTSAMNIIALGVTNQCPGSDIAETPYPAELDPYLSSEQEGVGNLTELVLDYQSCCPDSKIVLMGYSQVRSTIRYYVVDESHGTKSQDTDSHMKLRAPKSLPTFYVGLRSRVSRPRMPMPLM